MEHVESIIIFAVIGLILAIISFIGVMRLGVARILNGFKSFTSATFYLLCVCATVILGIGLSLIKMPASVSALLITMTLVVLWLNISSDENKQNED